MKKKKWLLIIVLIVFVINISFFILVRLVKVDEIVQERFSSYLSENLDANVSFGNFVFNDKQLRISNVKIVSPGKFMLDVEQIYVEYNLQKLLITRFANLRAIKHIKIYDPVFRLNMDVSYGKKKKKKFDIPDITKYFKALDIYNGKITIEISDNKFDVSNTWQDVSVSVKNTSESVVKLSAVSQESSEIKTDAILKKGKIIFAQIEMNDFFPDEIQVPILESISSKLDFKLNYETEKLTYDGKLKDIKAELTKKKFRAENIHLSGDNRKIRITSKEVYFDNNKIDAHAVLNDFLKNERSIIAFVGMNDVSLSHYLDLMDGKVSAEINIEGKVSEPVISAKVFSDSIEIAEQKIKNIDLTAELVNNSFDIYLNHSSWEGNLIYGNGKYSFSEGFEFEINSDDVLWKKNNIEISGDLNSKILFSDKPDVHLQIDNLHFQNEKIGIDDLLLKARLVGNDYLAGLSREKGDILLNFDGNLKRKETNAKLSLKRFDLNSTFQDNTLPLISGNMNVEINEFSIVVASVIRAYDRDFGKLDGRFVTNFVADLTNNRTFLNLKSHNAKFNYEPFEINLLAEGTLDSIHTKQFKINRNIDLDTWIRVKPVLNYGITLSAKKLKLRDIAKYFTDYYTSSKLMGDMNLDIAYDNCGKGLIEGSLDINNFRIGKVNQIDANIHLSGNNSFIKISNSNIFCKQQEILKINSDITLKPELNISASGVMKSLDLQNVVLDSSMLGNISGKFSYLQENSSKKVNVSLEGTDLKINRLHADSIRFIAVQEDSLLSIDDFSLIDANDLKLSAKGSIGYNLLNNNSYADTNSINISFEGNLLKLISKQTKVIKSGNSRCNFNLNVIMTENGISIDHSDFSLSRGVLEINDQLEEIDKIAIQFDVKDNIFDLKKFKFRMGEGWFYVKNEVGYNEDDFKLGMLNLGKFFVHTNKNGLLFHIPEFTPGNSVAKIIIAGRYTDELEVTGPFDDIKIYGDIYTSNGDVIYPPDTENLMKLFNKVTVEKKESSTVSLPFTLDIIVHFDENLRYVTYPVDVKITPGGYLHLKYEEGEFILSEALFTAEEGSIDVFGTEMLLDYMKIQLSHFDIGAKISGTFYKKISDGTLITLEIYNEESKAGAIGTLKFALESDDPNDLMTDILAKLRYNRTMDEISQGQKKTILQDEAIQIAGVGLKSAIIDPLISPVENWTRKVLHVDYFHLQVDLIQNLFASYSSENKEEYYYTQESNQIAQFSSDLFLNNLAVSIGKYVTRSFFIDYELRVERPGDLAVETATGVYQEFLLRYDLPLKFKISYRYDILPFEEENTHEIMLERSFRF
ncbi:MAG: hypothetical protein K8R49_04430 [Candidatus Cloacimonetes bacterium]|nr:hypothetical protein [Candidatus Cloacimonadota bacterium]